MGSAQLEERGGVPPVRDQASTPEDEYALHRYAFKPYVYREHYENAEGDEGGYYVVGYTSGKPAN